MSRDLRSLSRSLRSLSRSLRSVRLCRLDRFDSFFDCCAVGRLGCGFDVRLVRGQRFGRVAGALPRLADALKEGRLFGDVKRRLVLLRGQLELSRRERFLRRVEVLSRRRVVLRVRFCFENASSRSERESEHKAAQSTTASSRIPCASRIVCHRGRHPNKSVFLTPTRFVAEEGVSVICERPHVEA